MKICSNCGRMYSDMVKICPECKIQLPGNLNQSPYRPQPYPQPQPQPQPRQVPEFDIQNNVLVKYNGSASRVMIPAGVVHIGKEAFANNHAVQYVTIPDGVYGLSKDCFLNCTNLREVNIPGTVATARFDWFAGCVNLDRLVLQPGVQKLHTGTKLHQLYAKQIEFPDSLTNISWITIGGEDHMGERMKHPKRVVASPWWIQSHSGFFRDNPDFSADNTLTIIL